MEVPSLNSITQLLGLDFYNDPVIKETANLFELYFDHSEFLDAECKYFIREFETRRGNEDFQALQELVQQRKSGLSIMDSVTEESSKHIDNLLLSISQVTKSVNEQLAKEEGYVLQAAKKMKELQVKMKDDQEVYTNELNAYKDKIDKEFFEKEKKLREIYHVPEEVKERMEKKRDEFKQKEQQQTWFSKRLV